MLFFKNNTTDVESNTKVRKQWFSVHNYLFKLNALTLINPVAINLLNEAIAYRGSYKGWAVCHTVHEQKRKTSHGSRITDIKISFSRISKINKYDTLFNNLLLG